MTEEIRELLQFKASLAAHNITSANLTHLQATNVSHSQNGSITPFSNLLTYLVGLKLKHLAPLKSSQHQQQHKLRSVCRAARESHFAHFTALNSPNSAARDPSSLYTSARSIHRSLGPRSCNSSSIADSSPSQPDSRIAAALVSRIDHAEARRNYLTAIRIGCVFGVFRALFLPIRLRCH